MKFINPPFTPYAVSIKNKSDTTARAILFGKNIYYESANFGSDKDIVITNLQGSASYAQLFAQSGNCPFYTSKIRIIATNKEQAEMCWSYNISDANGDTETECIASVLYVNPLQNDKESVTIDIVRKIDGRCYLEMSILPKNTVTVAIYPGEKPTKISRVWSYIKKLLRKLI